MSATPITATVDIPGYEPTGTFRLPMPGESYLHEDGTVHVALRRHRARVVLVLTPTAPKEPELPYIDCIIDTNGIAEDGDNFSWTCAAHWRIGRFIGYVYADGSVRGEPYRFQSAVDPVELPVAVRIHKESAK